MMSPFRWRFLLALLTPLALGPRDASAHAGLPETSSVAQRRNHPEDLFVGATFGAAISRDSGQTWRWVCPEAMGYGGWRPSAFLWQERGDLLAATGSALIRSRDGGCSWATHPFFATTWVTHLAEHPTDERILYVATGKPNTPNAVYRSEDGGETWRATALQRPDVAFSAVMVSGADPKRLYASGYDDTRLLLYRSDDEGATWTELHQPLAGYIWPYDLILLKVSTTQPGVLWARVSAQGVSYVLRSDDAGQTLKEVLRLDDVIIDAESSADDATVWVSTPVHLYRSRNGAAFETLTLPEGNACTRRVGDVLYGCGSAWVHEWSLARSTDEGSTWAPFMDLARIQGPHQCPAGTPTQQLCPSRWPALAEVLGAQVDFPTDGGTEPPPPPDAGSGGTDGGTPPGEEEPPKPPAKSDGCGASSGLLPSAALLFTRALLRRRAQAPSPSGRGRG